MKISSATAIGITAIIVTLATVPLEDWYDDYRKSSANVVQVNKSERVLALTGADVATISKVAQASSDRVFFTTYRVVSTGRDDIAEKSIAISAPSGFIAAGSMELPGQNPRNVKITYQPPTLTVTYRLLSDGQSHRFWVAQGNAEKMTVEKDSPGLVVTAQAPPSAGRGFSWSFVSAIAGVLATLAALFAQRREQKRALQSIRSAQSVMQELRGSNAPFPLPREDEIDGGKF